MDDPYGTNDLGTVNLFLITTQPCIDAQKGQNNYTGKNLALKSCNYSFEVLGDYTLSYRTISLWVQ